MDLISELPEPLKEKILFALPTKDAIRMSFSSRHWQSLWNTGWNSLPVTRINLEDSVSMEDSFTSSLLEHEGQKRIVHFSLGDGVEEMTRFDVDRWIKMVTQYYVTELKLDITHSFPPATFDVGSLVVLSLTNCILDPALIQKDTIFCHLKSLGLRYVDLNGLVGELFSRCPLLESLDLTYCEDMQHVELCDVPNLKNVVVMQNYSDVPHTFKMQAPNLESLDYQECARERPLNLEEVCCRNLKRLDIDHQQTTITNQYIEEVVLKFPLLEDLVLNADCFASADDIDDELKTCCLNISSRSLTKLNIAGETSDAMNIIIDAPSLVSYESHSSGVSHSISFKSVKLEKHILCLDEPTLDTEWFIHLRSYLGKCSPHVAGLSEIKIYSPQSVEKKISSKLPKTEVTPRPRVRELALVRVPFDPADDAEALIDGLLWSCQPMQVRVQMSHDNDYENNFIKSIHEMLMDGERESPCDCCQETHYKCWRHYLKSVTLQSYIITNDGTEHCYSNENSTMDLTHFEEPCDAIFALQWFDDLK
ncbi:PREDICTED: putative FBD-associated F-box protein At1g05080 [Fragaria vesca subsp. vesca]|uniref:putative FBD-associated F-box protein At1g05080 n=1 Tax=Fragaria vesca subsp. vesca TaxID=101020 RepID=UPI0002C33DBB|nr:PREDICTED: putative FBD-associated F-box protein At1g05080 [Fragaria vesca subsp. vesca]